ncbi:hypothetical protein [Streptomyces sp. NPDC058653]
MGSVEATMGRPGVERERDGVAGDGVRRAAFALSCAGVPAITCMRVLW